MKIQLLILAVTILSGNTIAGKKDIPEELLIESIFYPSFHHPVKLKLYKSREDGYLTFIVLDKKDEMKAILTDSVLLTKNDFAVFFKKLRNTSLLKIPNDSTRTGNDGITLKTKILQDGQVYQFESWSPPRNDFLDALFELLNKKLPAQENYIEDIQTYFDYGLPVKIKSTAPFIARFYGGISIDFYDELLKFFKKVPKRRKAVLDMSNFWVMGKIFYDDFEEFDLSHPKLIWVIPSNKREYFKEIGIDSSKMVESLNLAMERK